MATASPPHLHDGPRVLIVIVTYNRADATCMMLESLYEVKTNIPFDVYVIDNRSKKEERDLIKATFDRVHAPVGRTGTFFDNPTNAGYSAGNNIGIRHAFENSEKYTHLCLLNNDTIVTDLWLDRLIEGNKNGLVGPVSNSVGNEQRVPGFYDSKGTNPKLKESVYEYAKQWHQLHQGNWVRTRMLGFFCVFGPTSIFKQLGYLDEAFGIGTYEDDDYCCRARNQGIEMWIARDVFIHHWGSASFSKLSQKVFYDLMEKNRKIYEAKNKEDWIHPVTTPLDCYRDEVVWSVTHPEVASSDLIQKSLVDFETTVRSQIRHGYTLDTLFKTAGVSAVIDYWVQQNLFASARTRKFLTWISTGMRRLKL